MPTRVPKGSKGFTLIELMIVVAILGILVAIAIPNFMTYQAKARQAEVKAVLGGIFATANSLLGPKPRHRRRSTEEPYESGLPSEVKKSMRFGISFYLVAMLFILFDIEVVFLYPIAVQLRHFGTFALSETIVFIALLAIAFLYVWRRGALNWR